MSRPRVSAEPVSFYVCSADACYRTAKGYHLDQPLCERHIGRYRDRRAKTARRNKYDFVSDPAGPECRICGRSVYTEHEVAEFCRTSAA